MNDEKLKMTLPKTSDLRAILNNATDEAEKYNHEDVATEHLLYGIVTGGNTCALRILQNLDVNLKSILAKTKSAMSIRVRVDPTAGETVSKYTEHAHNTLALAEKSAIELGLQSIDTEHLLLGLLLETNGIASDILKDAGVNQFNVRGEILKKTEQRANKTKESATTDKANNEALGGLFVGTLKLKPATNSSPVSEIIHSMTLSILVTLRDADIEWEVTQKNHLSEAIFEAVGNADDLSVIGMAVSALNKVNPLKAWPRGLDQIWELFRSTKVGSKEERNLGTFLQLIENRTDVERTHRTDFLALWDEPTPPKK